MTPGHGHGHGHSFVGGLTEWTPALLGDDLLLWLRPEDLLSANRLLQTNDLEDPAWLLTGGAGVPTFTSGQSDPDGGNTAFLVKANTASASTFYQDAQGYQPGSTDVASIWYKRGPSHNGTSLCRFRLADGINNSDVLVLPPVDWTRIDWRITLDALATRNRIRIWPDDTTSSEAVYFWHPQLELGEDPSNYVENTTLAAGQLNQWNDASGNGRHLTQSTSSAMPLVEENVYGDLHGVRFDGVDDWLDNALTADYNYGDNGEVTLVEVFKIDGSQAVNHAWFSSDAAAERGVFYSTAHAVWFHDSSGANAMTNSSIYSDDVLLVVKAYRNASDEWFCEINGVDQTKATPITTTGFAVLRTLAKRSSEYSTGYFLEGFIYNNALSTGQQANVNTYLSDKYGAYWGT